MSAYAGWWALDLGAYLLSRPSTLGGVVPSELDVDQAIGWIRRNELPWAPGCSDLGGRDWAHLKLRKDDVDLVDWVLATAAQEIEEARSHATAGGEDAPIDLIARNRFPISTLKVLGYDALRPGSRGDLADAHVHQGATLPMEVTMHWVARMLAPATDAIRKRSSRLLRSVGGEEAFDPMPYLIALRVVLCDPLNWERALELAKKAAPSGGDQDAWTELAQLVDDPSAESQSVDLHSIVELKKDAETTWDRRRRIALYRLEAILHGAVTQQAPGLDVFVDLFEDFSAMRRRRLPKSKYYERSILEHTTQSPTLRAIELRLGEPIYAADPPSSSQLAEDYAEALTGYRSVLGTRNTPVRVSFPLSLVKTLPSEHTCPEGWRFDPRGVYALVEEMIHLFCNCPSLVPFVDGLDVCGNECDAPNWLFAPAFGRFASWMKSNGHAVTLRFHAGEWQATPLHGLRRIHEFVSFDLPPGTTRRVGHALALSSKDWTRLGGQAADELLDDLVWAYAELRLANAPSDLVRLVEREINDLAPVVYPPAPTVDAEALSAAFEARREPELLRRIGFLAGGPTLDLPSMGPYPSSRPTEQLMIEHLRAREEPLPTAASLVPVSRLTDPEASLERLRLLLSDAYDVLAPEVGEDLRWKNIVVEACPTSNVIAGGVRGFRHHPLRKLIDNGLLTTLGSDDPSLFHTWIGDEVATAERMIKVPSRQVGRSQQLGAAIVAPAFYGAAVLEHLNEALAELDEVKRRAGR
jgi:hypothetical protein